MRRFAVSVFLAACARAPAPPPQHVSRAVAPPASVASASAPTATPPADPITDLVARWNDAHNRHHAAALGAVYAPIVDFYESELSNAECVRRKQAALAAAPDYRQTLSEMEVAPVDQNGGVFVRFKKTTTVKGRSKSYLGYLYSIDGHVVAEGDRMTAAEGNRYTFCYGEGGPSDANDARPGEYKVSALEALIAVRHSAVFVKLASAHRAGLDLMIADCAHDCAPGDFGSCKDGDLVPYDFVVSDGNDQLGEFTVHSMTKAIRFEKKKED